MRRAESGLTSKQSAMRSEVCINNAPKVCVVKVKHLRRRWVGDVDPAYVVGAYGCMCTVGMRRCVGERNRW